MVIGHSYTAKRTKEIVRCKGIETFYWDVVLRQEKLRFLVGELYCIAV